MHQVDYRYRYKSLKQKLKFLIYEQECFLEELRKSQKKLLRVTRDKSFLLDRLLLHINVDETSGDSDATPSSDSEPDTAASRRKKVGLHHGGHLSGLQTAGRKRIKPAPKRTKTVKSAASKQPMSRARQHIPGQMTRAELEQHLATKTDYNGIEVPPNKLPSDIFSDNSTHISDDADEDLVIDAP